MQRIESLLYQSVATYARKKLSVSNNRDLMYILENSGIYILEKNLGATIDAYSTCTEDGRLYIILGTMRKSPCEEILIWHMN